MFDIPFDILPKAAVPAVMATSLFAYFVAGPEIGSRIARADYLPACQGEVAAMIAAGAGERSSTLDAPAADDGKADAADQLRALLASPVYETMRQNPITRPVVEALKAKLRGFEGARDAARKAKEAARRQVDAWTATNLARTGSVCGCMADRAIAEARTDWAIFAGTLGLVRTARIGEFGETMRRSDPDGICRREMRS